LVRVVIPHPLRGIRDFRKYAQKPARSGFQKIRVICVNP
jgi:hypothetical protein